MSSQTVARTIIGKIKAIIGIIAIIMTIISYFVLNKQSIIIRVSILIIGLSIALCLIFSLTQWCDFINFTKESIRETKKVIWPTRKEATQITIIVFAFVLIMAIFLWSIDKLFEFLLYDMILVWK